MAAVAGDTPMAPQSTFAPNLAPTLAPTLAPNAALGSAPGAPRWYRTGALMLELCLTLLIAALLAHIAAPLALPDLAPGLGQRFASVPADTLAGSPNQRAQWLARHAASVLMTAAASGWVALVLARRGRRGGTATMLSLLCLAAGVTGVADHSLAFWGAWSAGLALLAALRTVVGYPTPHTASGGPACFSAAVLWPLCLACAGLGWLYLSDFAARGPLSTRYLGARHWDALWLSTVCLCLVCRFADALAQLLAGLALAARRLGRRPVGAVALLMVAAVVAIALAWVGRRVGSGGLGLPHVSGEWARWPLLLAAAWFGYRRLDWDLSQASWAAWRSRVARSWPGLLGGSLAAGLAACVWVGSQDWGPAMVIALAMVSLIGALLILPSALSLRARLAASLWVMVMAFAWVEVATVYLPAHNARAAERELMRSAPFDASSDQGAHAQWLIAAAPPSGFGLARVPWCGARAHVGLEPCTPVGRGVGVAFASDLPVVGLRAIWGLPGAALALAALVGLYLAAFKAALARAAAGHPPAVLAAWVVAVFAITSLVQLALVAAANLGHLPLSGLGLPLLANGTHAALALALWLGLACHAGKDA